MRFVVDGNGEVGIVGLHNMNKHYYRITATVRGMREPFVDWFEADSAVEAESKWKVEAEVYGLSVADTALDFLRKCGRDYAIILIADRKTFQDFLTGNLSEETVYRSESCKLSEIVPA